MTERTKSEEKGKKSTDDGNLDETLLSDGSEKTEEPLKSHNFKGRPFCLYAIVFLSILLLKSFIINIHYMSKEKQSCILDESCQNITSPQMLIDPDGYNCSRKLAGNGITNVERILKLELWEEELKIVVQLPTNFILHKIQYDDEREIVLCRKERNYYYISCNKPYNDNCTIIHRSEENTTITIQEAGDRMLTYEIFTKCIDQRAGLEWIQPQKYWSP